MTGVFRHAFIPPPPPSPFVLSYAADVVAPTLNTPTGVESGATTANGTVSTDDSTGTLYWVVTQSASSPSVAQIQAGQDHTGSPADASGNQAVSGTGVQNVSATGLTTQQTYYFHYQQQDAATNDSTVVTSSSFYVGAPTLSSASASGVSATEGSGSVSTDEADGTLYWVVTQSVTSPSVAQVQAGQDHTSTAADDSGSQAVAVAGTQVISSTGLTEDTTYYIHFQHQDDVSNDSTVITSNAFTPTSFIETVTAVAKDIASNIIQDLIKS